MIVIHNASSIKGSTMLDSSTGNVCPSVYRADILGTTLLSLFYWYAKMPRIQWVPGREGDHSPPSSAEVKNAWSYISTHPCIFMAWCL